MTHEKRITLDPRLSMMAEMVGRCASFADIGCDHGRLSAFLLQRGWAENAILTDISARSLDKARALIRLLGLESRARFCVCDGADGLDAPVDVVAIAGMGGDTIGRIVEHGQTRFGGARLILQANVAIPELRARLNEAGYRISDERIAKDGRRQYVMIEAVPGSQSCDLCERIVGPVLLRTRPEALADYAAFRLRVARKALLGAEKGGDADGIRALQEEIGVWEDVAACL